MAVYEYFEEDFLLNIVGVSYFGNPKNNTMMYLTRKIENKINYLRDTKNSLIFLERGISVPLEVSENNIVVMCDDPVLTYTDVTMGLFQSIEQRNRERKITFTKDFYYIGEDVIVGQNVFIEPNVFIEHNVRIGDNTIIKTGAKIRTGTVIGESCVIGENSVIGEPAFNTTKNNVGDLIMVPSFGNVIIGNNVYIGANTSISRGGADDTIIEDWVKIDSNVRVGHDVHLCKRVELLGSCAVAGYCFVGEDTVIAVNSTLKNRTNVGKKCFVGMGSVVHHNVKDGITVSGSPARTLEQIGKQLYIDAQIKELIRKNKLER